MARRSRDLHPGGIYHIYQRGNNKSYVFNDHTDKAAFISIIKKTIGKFPCHFLYYVLMDNHYHLVVEMMDAEISTIMRDVNRRYCQYFNRKYDRTGSIFDGRYMSQAVKDTRYFLKLLQYIANNPVKAGLVQHPSQYRWGAHMEMVSKQSVLVDKNRLLSYFDESFSRAVKSYMANIECGAGGSIEFADLDSDAEEESLPDTSHARRSVQEESAKISQNCTWYL